MRGKRAKKRTRKPDHKYNDQLVTRFINKLMVDGKKSKAEGIFYSALEKGAAEFKVEPMEFLNKVVDNIRPSLEIKARRVGGANYSVPMPVSPARQETLAIRWLVDTTRAKGGDSIENILKNSMVDAFNGTGDAVKKKEETERMAEANKAFAHFRW